MMHLHMGGVKAPVCNSGLSVSRLTEVFEISSVHVKHQTRIVGYGTAIQLYCCIAVHKAVLLTVKILYEQPYQDFLFCLPCLRRVDPQSPT